MKYRVNEDTAIHNFVTTVAGGLECAEDSELAGVGTFFFLGVFFSFLLWIKCTDAWGRKPIIILGSLLQIGAFAGILFYTHSLRLLEVYYFFLGLGTVISTCTSYNLLIEYTPRHSKIMMATFFLSL